MAPSVSVLTETGFHSIVSFPHPHPHPLVLSVNKSPADVTFICISISGLKAGAPNVNFRKMSVRKAI